MPNLAWPPKDPQTRCWVGSRVIPPWLGRRVSLERQGTGPAKKCVGRDFGRSPLVGGGGASPECHGNKPANKVLGGISGVPVLARDGARLSAGRLPWVHFGPTPVGRGGPATQVIGGISAKKKKCWVGSRVPPDCRAMGCGQVSVNSHWARSRSAAGEPAGKVLGGISAKKVLGGISGGPRLVRDVAGLGAGRFSGFTGPTPAWPQMGPRKRCWVGF